MQEGIIQIVVYLFSAAMTIGTVLWRIKELEKRVDKHNNLIERIVAVEQNIKSSWYQIDEIKEILRKE